MRSCVLIVPSSHHSPRQRRGARRGGTATDAPACPDLADHDERPRPVSRTGPYARPALVAARLAAARPDEGEGLAVLVVEEVGEDRRVEARIIELDREILAALTGALRPGGPDLGAADIDPMAGGVVVGPVGLGNDADTLRLDAQGDDLALELAADLLEGTDVSHVTSPCCFRTRDHRGLDGDLQAGGDRRRTRSRAGAERRMAAVRLSCLARNGRSPGEESLSDAVAAQAIEAQPSSGQISQREAVGPRRTASSGEDVADPEGPVQESRPTRRKARSRGVRKGPPSLPFASAMPSRQEASSDVARSGRLCRRSRTWTA